MSLTKEDKEEIRAIIREECGIDFGESLLESMRRSPLEQLGKKWEYNGTKSESTDLIIAPEDVEIDGKTDFTWDEVMALEKEGKIPEGWRLPTRHEWVMIAEEFGQDYNGAIDGKKLEGRLNLDIIGYYWSSTVNGSSSYILSLGSSSATTFAVSNSDGLCVRCVKEKK